MQCIDGRIVAATVGATGRHYIWCNRRHDDSVYRLGMERLSNITLKSRPDWRRSRRRQKLNLNPQAVKCVRTAHIMNSSYTL